MALPWFKVAPDFADHPKTEELAATLGVSQATALGIVVRGWCWTSKYCPTGEIPANRVLALKLKVGLDIHKQFDADPLTPINPEEVFAALLKTGWLEPNGNGGFLFHDWPEFNASYFQAIELRKSADRKRKRNSNGIPVELRNVSTEIHSPDVDRDRDLDKKKKQEATAPASGRPVEKEKADPRFKPLRDAICQAFLEETGEKYDWKGAKDSEALKRLARKAPDDQILYRWRWSIHEAGFYRCRTVAALESKWNEFAGMEPGDEREKKRFDPNQGIIMQRA